MTEPSESRNTSHDAEADRLGECIDRMLDEGHAGAAAILGDVPSDDDAELVRQLEAFHEIGRSVRLDIDEDPRPLGDYTLHHCLGRGGSGSVVYQAWENSLERWVALKVLPRELAADTKAFLRFMREAKTAGQVSHPNVVPVYGMGVVDETPYFAMELVDGLTLAEAIAGSQVTPSGGRESALGTEDEGVAYWARIASAFAGVAEGLQLAHLRGVIHRDIKPSNLMIEEAAASSTDTVYSSRLCLRVLDFGLARQDGDTSLTLTGECVGTPTYMSPEQARRSKVQIDRRTDIYSLGVTLFEVATGQPPFHAERREDTLTQIISRDPPAPRTLNPRVPRDLETLILKCLNKDPGDRFRTIGALAEELRRFARGEPIETSPESRAARWFRRARRQRAKIAALAVIGLAAGVGLWFAAREVEMRAERLAGYDVGVRSAALSAYGSEITLQAAAGVPGSLFNPKAPCLTPVRVEDFRADRWRARAHAALAQLDDWEEARPDRPDAAYHRARIWRLLGDRDRALGEAGRALGVAPDFVPAQIAIWELAPDGESPSEGEIDRFLSTLQTKDGWQSLWLRGWQAKRTRAPDKAIQSYSRFLAEHAVGDEPFVGARLEATLGRGLAHLARREHLAAARDFDFVRRADRGFLEPTLLLAKAYHRHGEKREAQTLLEALYADAPADSQPEVATWITSVYAGVWAREKAERWAALAGGPLTDRVVAFNRYFTWRNREAAETARRALEASPDDAVGVFLGYALLELISGRSGPQRDDDVREASDVAEHMITVYPNDELARALLGFVRLAEGRLDEAERKGRALSEEPVAEGRVLGLVLLSRIASERECLVEAERYARHALGLAETRYTILALGTALGEQGRWEEAAELFERCVEIRSRRATAYGHLARAFNELGRHEDAERVCEAAHGLFPENTAVPEELARARWALGRPHEALAAVDAGLERVPDRTRLVELRQMILAQLEGVGAAPER